MQELGNESSEFCLLSVCMVSIETVTKGRRRAVMAVTAGMLLACLLVAAQTESQPSKQNGDQSQVPDAPSASRPAPFPADTAPAPKNPTPGNRPAPTSDDGEAPLPPAPPPMATVRTVPSGQARDIDSRDDFVIHHTVNMVVVPVTVKDKSGRLVDGLLKKDFSVLENGVEQRLTLFTSDPFPLSAAVVLDANLPENAMRKVNETLPALAGAFSEFDEVSLFTYGNSVEKRLDFQAPNDALSSQLKKVKPKGRSGGVAPNSGPLAIGPTVNGRPLDPSKPSISADLPHREYFVLNDAILAAATELSRRDRARRKVIFVISDGREDGSAASYKEVLKVLLSNEISVYAIGVDAAAIPGYDKLSQIRVPRMGYGNILPKYVSATGGEVFAEFTRPAIEAAYARLTEQARNQYTLGYNTNNVLASNYRSIEVRVSRPGLDVRAKDGYYPLPISRQERP
jgi:VWFA-related protein